MELTQLVQRRQQELRNQLNLLENNDLTSLIKEKDSLQHQINAIDSKVAELCKNLGIETPKSGEEAKRRRRMSGDEIRDRILGVLNAHHEGLSQAQIIKESGVVQASVVNFIKENASSLRIEGTRKSKRIFLKH